MRMENFDKEYVWYSMCYQFILKLPFLLLALKCQCVKRGTANFFLNVYSFFTAKLYTKSFKLHFYLYAKCIK